MFGEKFQRMRSSSSLNNAGWVTMSPSNSRNAFRLRAKTVPPSVTRLVCVDVNSSVPSDSMRADKVGWSRCCVPRHSSRLVIQARPSRPGGSNAGRPKSKINVGDRHRIIDHLDHAWMHAHTGAPPVRGTPCKTYRFELSKIARRYDGHLSFLPQPIYGHVRKESRGFQRPHPNIQVLALCFALSGGLEKTGLDAIASPEHLFVSDATNGDVFKD